MSGPIELEDLADYQSPTVYIACIITSPDPSGQHHELLGIAEKAFSRYGFRVYNPARHTMRGSPHHPHEVTAIDHLEAMRADLILFIRVDRSTGMGIEAQVAADMLIPWTDAKP